MNLGSLPTLPPLTPSPWTWHETAILIFIACAIATMAVAVISQHRLNREARAQEAQLLLRALEWKETATEWLVQDAEDTQLHVWQERERPSR
jgi:ABC-type transport system involved in cytochrome bd biosynthesis fused ATPase/permease subunit